MQPCSGTQVWVAPAGGEEGMSVCAAQVVECVIEGAGIVPAD
jgi:hypothetical protein